MSSRKNKRSRRLNPEDPPTPESSDHESDSSSTTAEQDNMATFSLTPAQANPGDIIDYTTASGLKLYNAATEALPV